MPYSPFSGERLAQRPSEFDRLLEFLNTRGVRRVLEIGTRHGDTLHAFGQMVGQGGAVVGVDLPAGPWGHPDGQANTDRAIADLVERFHVEASVIYGDSKSAEVIAQARARGPFDFVFIDGDHSAEGVRADWRNYGALAPLIGFHDVDAGILPKRKRARYGVPALFEELMDAFPTTRFNAPPRAMGIGVVHRPAAL